MFTGIVQGIATITAVVDHDGLRTLSITFPQGFCNGLAIGASVAIDGVCLTVTRIQSECIAEFDVMIQSLRITSLTHLVTGSKVNAERAAKDGAEIGGHPLSGHVDFCATVVETETLDANYRLRISVEPQWMKYIFSKGYIAINGTSLTIAEVDKKNAWFEVWLIPETRRMTTFNEKTTGALLNIEIERATQVVVDTVRDALEEKLGHLLPLFEQLLDKNGIDLNQLAIPQTQKN